MMVKPQLQKYLLNLRIYYILKSMVRPEDDNTVL